MLPSTAQAAAAERAHAAHAGPKARWLTRWLGRIGMPAATAVIATAAVVAAVLLHFVIGAARGAPFLAGAVLQTALIAMLVVTPIVIYAQIVIKRHAEARRSLKQVTERLALAVNAAEQANRAQTQFLANMSHELRTPLNAIIGFADLIQSQKFGPVGHQRYLDYVKDIAQSGHHLLRIINDILDLAKIDAGRTDVRDEEEFNLTAVIDATLRMMRPLAERQGVALDTAGDLRGLRLLAVERMVCQILLNLLSNAVKFTAAGGRVAIAASRSVEGGLLVSVTDNGLGMSPEEIATALTPFGQVANAMSRKHTGTGLGLPLAKAMMELHGGKLLIASTPGKGTTVSLAFPPARVIRAAPEPARAAAANAEAPASPRTDAADPARRTNASRAA